ncbi:Vps62-related protein [Nocardia sp. NPDC101769]|uniref:Vps62-related protein n=1 Tax=Nocardia sp. NPDC101769 TaxID=3364333 RepID=UPI0037FBE9A4
MISQRYGDLELGFTTNFVEQRFNTHLGETTLGFWRPIAPAGWSVLGTYWTGGGAGSEYDPRGKHGGLIVKDASSAGLLRPPVDYELIWSYFVYPSYRFASLWRPIPPAGYVALGDYFQGGTDKPPADAMVCVKKTHQGRDLVREGETSRGPLFALNYGGLVSGWTIVAPPYPNGDLDEHLYVPTGLHTAVTGWDRPSPTAVTWVLDLPAVVEEGPDPELPVLHSYDAPPEQTVVTDRIVTVPYFMVKDTDRDEKWKVDNSPFYKLRRKRHYELILFRDNEHGSESQTASEAIETGVSTSMEESFSETTGITVGFSMGVEASAKPFGMGVSTTMESSVSTAIELGYERRYGVTSMESTTITQQLTIPPRSSGALWMERHELLPVRADGAMVSTDGKLPFRTKIYRTGQYPPASESGEKIGYQELAPNGQPLPEALRQAIPAPEETKPDETLTA